MSSAVVEPESSAIMQAMHHRQFIQDWSQQAGIPQRQDRLYGNTLSEVTMD